MSDEIQPALTPEEWAAIERERAVGAESMGKDAKPLTGIGIGYETGWLPTGDLHNPFTPHQLIALLNAALSADDPKKITRDDVVLLRETAETVRIHGEYNDDVFDEDERQPLYTLAAKLAALLPP